MEVISPFVLRAIACDMEEMQSPQAWADRCRAAAAEIEKLRAELKQARRDALEEAARLVNQTAGVLSNPSAKDALNYAAAAIRALGEKE